MRSVFADRTGLTKQLLRHYLGPFPTPASREPLFAYLDTIHAANAWFDTLWAERAALADKPALLLWGMKDKLVPRSFLARWQEVFANAETLKLEGAGHFVQEEASEQVARAVQSFLEKVNDLPTSQK
ncbi:hypothetical protein BH24DEI2_BH24DEI2_16180 [soil metagenome]